MKILGLSLLLLLIATSCSTEEKKQFEFGGGALTMALENEPSTYIPRFVRDYYSATVLNQITEGLVGFDPKTVKVIPKLAKEWSKSDDGKTYTFTLRNDVYFHPHKAFSSKEERLMSPEDVVKSFELACTLDDKGVEPSSYAMIFKSLLKGADEFIEGKADKISGVSIEGNTIKMELLHEDHNFLNKMANVSVAIVSRKIVESGAETDVIGTGPFVYDTYKTGDEPSLILVKNDDYYLKDDDGNALPYLDSLVFHFPKP